MSGTRISSSRFYTPCAIVCVLVVGFIFGIALLSRRQINEAKQFCESLVPVLEEERARNGSYPDSLQNSWWRGKRVPALIELNYLYVKLDHGHGFRLQFENPYALFDNVIAFRSERKGWYEYDANFNKAGWKPNPPVGDK